MIAPNLGSEFVPRLSEGSIVINVIRLAGIDLEESIRYNTQMEKALLAAFPDEIQYAWSRMGTAEVATDPMGVELSDIFITLKPREQWRRARTQDELTELIQKELRDLPGQRLAMTQPIEMRMNEMISGVRSDVAAILFGDDFDVLVKKAAEIERVLKSIPGAADVSTEQVTGQPVLQIRVNQDEIARYGIPAKTVLDLVESLGSKQVGEVYEGQLRFPLVVRLPESVRASPEAIGAVLVTTPSGQRIPLSRLATIETVEGPSTIKREWYQRRITVSANVRGRDMVSFVEEAKRKIAEKVQLPPGRYRVEWGGQFEHYESARRRLMLVVPLAIAADLRAALPDLPQRHRRPAGLHRRAVRLGRRHLRPLAARHAVLDLRGHRLHRHVGRRGAGRHDPGVLHPPASAEGTAAGRGGEGRGHDSPAARADDDARGQPGIRADGVEHGHGSGSAATAGDRGDRRRHQRDGDVLAGHPRAVCAVRFGRRWTRMADESAVRSACRAVGVADWRIPRRRDY